jgi:Na+-translocating ferredoxin:NAD+ oxidoreductase subunit C
MRAAAASHRRTIGLEDGRELSRDRPIENAPIPAVCAVAMRQCSGESAVCAVEVGDIIAEGMLVGRAEGPAAAHVHSPVPGRVAAVTDVRLSTGDWSQAVVVELEGRFARSGKPARRRDWRAMPVETIEARIRENGVVGLAGESFPLAGLWAKSTGGRRPETLVANGTEREPFLTGTHRLLVERAGTVVAGLRIAEKLLSPRRVVVVVDAAEPEARRAVEQAVRRAGLRYEVAALATGYPLALERHLLEAVTGLELPFPGTPEDIGCVLAGAQTLQAVYEAVVMDAPLCERLVTVSGVVRRPSNLKVRIGTSVRELVEECGGFTELPGKVVVGGPMAGRALPGLDVPVTKDVTGIVALSAKACRPPRRTPCISCGECARVCPAGLRPIVLHRQIEHGRLEDARAGGLEECSECGCCAFVCPAGIPLAESMRIGKRGCAAGKARA